MWLNIREEKLAIFNGDATDCHCAGGMTEQSAVWASDMQVIVAVKYVSD